MEDKKVAQKVFEAVVSVAPKISKGIIERRSYKGGENPSNEDQTEADDWADQLITEQLKNVEGIGELISEEKSGKIECGEGVSVAFDPLDGSSNIQSNNTVGTIVGIYNKKLPCKGENLISSFYILYGPMITAVKTKGDKVEEYLVENDGGSLTLLNDDLKLSDPRIYGFGGNKGWSKEFKKFENQVSEELKLRYGGSLVGDINQLIHYGGIFGYPKKESRPNGKLRLLYEANPIAHIVKTAGGISSNGDKTVLKTEARKLHQRIPFYVGNKQCVKRINQEDLG